MRFRAARYFSMDTHGLPTHSSPEPNKNAKGESHILGRSQEQEGKKRKNDGNHAKGFKKRKEGPKQDLKNLHKEISDQENLMYKLLHQLMPGSEELKLFEDKSAILCPDSNWDVLMSETKRPFEITWALKHRSMMVGRQIQLLYDMKFK